MSVLGIDTPYDVSVAGRFRTFVQPPKGRPIEVTTVRGTPTEIGEYSWTDPFDEQNLSITFPQVTLLDEWGHGDLYWLKPDSDVSVYWDGPLPSQFPRGFWVPSTDPDDWAFEPGPLLPGRPYPHSRWQPAWAWEGFFPSLEADSGPGAKGAAVEVIGAMFQLDKYLAKPEYPGRPLPYEFAIARQFLDRPHLRMGKLRVSFPDWWPTQFDPVAKTPWYLLPVGVQPGQDWTGYLTRSTGSWNPVLTGYVQQLLSSMYTKRGRFTLELMPSRSPQLVHRDIFSTAQTGFVRIDPADPGVKMSLRVDNDQSVGVVYGSGKSRSGTSYSGMTVTSDGQTTQYRPLAGAPQLHPETDARGWLDRSWIRRETMLELTEGLSQAEAAEVALQHLRRFGDPGVTGTIELTSTVMMDGERLHHMLMVPGMSVVVPKVMGLDELVLHVTEANGSFKDSKMTLTVDSKYRDALTLKEVRQRTRDALMIPRVMVAGQYAPPIPDQLVPWNYAEGSGVIPSGPNFNATQLFNEMPEDVQFPWTEWTTTHPPSDPRWRYSYIRCNPADVNADNNWAAVVNNAGGKVGFPIRLAQAGSIRLIQIAAYDEDGNVLPVEFHFSLYTMSGVNVQAMPIIFSGATGTDGYAVTQHYPFFTEAWEKYNLDGTLSNPQIPHPTDSVGLIKAWGTHYERPGHWPGIQSDPMTGLFVDEDPFTFDLTQLQNTFDPYSIDKNNVNPLAGLVYGMLYCDANGAEPAYFLGRMFRADPGSEPS
jgi:hypothetical protein